MSLKGNVVESMEPQTLNTQQIRLHLIQTLMDLFNDLEPQAHRDPETARVVGFIAQVLNSLCKSYDNRELDEELRQLEKIIEGLGHGAEAKEDSSSH